MNKIVDARGLNCPQPVILTKKAMEEPDSGKIITIVDREVAKENVVRLAQNQGYLYEVEQKGGEYEIHMHPDKVEAANGQKSSDIAILIKSRLFGEGEEELGSILMRSFVYTLSELDQNLKAVIFMNSGVLLALEDSPILEQVQGLEAKGVEILSCGTCLDYYKKTDQLAVGKITNMYTAAEILTGASKTLIF